MNTHILLFILVSLFQFSVGQDGLSVGFYRSTCLQAENITKETVTSHFEKNKVITGALLRMHFHDCFVKGCDASILIDSDGSNQAEKDAFPNLSVRGYELIDEIKGKLEAECPATVSCADVITLATRDGVVLAGGAFYDVPTGRRDGRVSLRRNVNLPGPDFSIAQASAAFSRKGLSLDDMVILLGAHSVGESHCSFFSDRLYDFNGSGQADPSMNATLVEELKKVCPPPNSDAEDDPSVFLDQSTSFVMDNGFYNQITQRKGILQIDQELFDHPSTNVTVHRLATNERSFGESFGKAMVKMGNIEVMTGNRGEIRLNCRVVNS